MKTFEQEECRPELSIVIVSWNTRELLHRCLRSIEDSIALDAAVETFVIDNASSDGSAEMVKQCFPSVKLIVNDANLGFALANNQGIARSQGRFVLLLNPDTEVSCDALHLLLQFMIEHPNAGAAGPLLLNPNGSLQRSCYPEPALARELWGLLHLDRFYRYANYYMEDWTRQSPREVEVLKGACLIIPKHVLDKVGTLDEDFFVYTEEVDLCHRIRKAGLHIYWVPTAKVIHYGGQSTGQVADTMFVQLFRSKVIFFRKHYGERRAQVYKTILLLTTLVRLAISPLIWLEPPSKRRRHFTLVHHYRKLILAWPTL